MATNFRVKMGRLTFIRRLGIPKRTESNIAIPISQVSIWMILLHRVQNLVNFGPVTPEFKMGKDVHPSSISSLATAASRRRC